MRCEGMVRFDLNCPVGWRGKVPPVPPSTNHPRVVRWLITPRRRTDEALDLGTGGQGMSTLSSSPESGLRGRFDALPTPSAGVSSRSPLGRIICAMEDPYHPLDDEAMLQANEVEEEAAAAAAGVAAGGGVAE